MMKGLVVIAAAMLTTGCAQIDKYQGSPYFVAIAGLVMGFLVGGLGGREEK